MLNAFNFVLALGDVSADTLIEHVQKSKE